MVPLNKLFFYRGCSRLSSECSSLYLYLVLFVVIGSFLVDYLLINIGINIPAVVRSHIVNMPLAECY